MKIQSRKLEIPSAYAYLLGAYLSDGWLRWPAEGAPRPGWTVKDKYFANCIGKALDTIGSPFSLRTYNRKRRGAERPTSYRIYEKKGGKLGWWLDDVAPDKDCLPYVPKELVRPLIAGLMDGDGGVYKTPKGRYRLHFTGWQRFVEDFLNLLRDLSIPVYDSNYHLNLQVSLSIESFLKAGLCFAMPRKQDKLVGWCHQKLRRPRRPGFGGWATWERRAAVAEWYLKNANHAKGPLIPTGCTTYPIEVTDD